MKTSDFLGGGGSSGVKLKGAQVAAFVPLTQTLYGICFSAAAINASASLVQLCSIDVPAGRRMILKHVELTGLTTTAQPTLIELEIDGVVVLTTNDASSGASTPGIVGSGAAITHSRAVSDLLVETNVKVRLRKAAATSAGINVSYILVD